LTILDLGEINFENPDCHTINNLYPFGFKSRREHPSAINPGKRTIYTNEIII
jgi:hypothetical protein